MVKVNFFALVILILIGNTSGIELSDVKKFFTSLLKTRQCREEEVIACLTTTWSNCNCQFQDGMISVKRNQGGTLVAAACSLNLLRDFYTPENALTDVYIKIEEIGYTKTASSNRFSVRLSEWEKLCFVQETVKCFEKFDCDIHSHSSNLKKVYDDCQKPLPIILNTVALFFKKMWAELKNIF